MSVTEGILTEGSVIGEIDALTAAASVGQDEHRAFWNGREHAYIPPAQLSIDPSLRFHSRRLDDVDPVTFEVIRFALLNLNLEHSAMINKLCVSPITMNARDYQTSILTEHGDLVFLGPNVQYFSNSQALCIKYTLENRSADPGIHAGDMFLSNDVYIGAPHEPDVCISAPVFIGDELFCWVANTLHYADVGGTMPGGFVMNARDVWDEPLNWPPVKIVAHGRISAEIEALFLRQSRFPFPVSMDLRAAIAANEYARGKILALCDRYGPEAVKYVLHGVLDAGEHTVAERLRAIPDGTWRHRAFTEAAVVGDRTIYSYQVNITKRGDRLIVDNHGTDPQAGAINVSYAAFTGAVLCAISQQLAPEMNGAYGGIYRCVEFHLQSGLANCAEFPAAVSPSGMTTTMIQINAAVLAIDKMLCCGGEDARRLALGVTMPHAHNMGVAGVDARGRPYAHIGLSCIMGSIGGRPYDDGVDIGGHWWMPGAIGPNLEDMEAHDPVVFLYRRLPKMGLDGAGRYRGGLGFEESATLRGSASGDMMFMFGESFPKGAGLLGAPPGSRAYAVIVRDSDVFEVLASGRVPFDTSTLSGERERPGFKAPAADLKDGDVWDWSFPTMAGFGDPLLRDPEAVLKDVAELLLDTDTAERVYGVSIRDGAIDEAETVRLRHAIRQDRLGGEAVGDPVEPPSGAQRISDVLHVVEGRWWCNGHDLGAVTDNYKNSALLRERPVRQIGPEYATDDHEMADRIVLREFVCPVTGYVIDTELALAGSPLLHDVQLTAD